MKICVASLTSAGKSVTARHCVFRRNPHARFIEVESVNLAPVIDEKAFIKIRGEQTPTLIREITLNRDVVIDAGASNAEDFLAGLSQYEGTANSIDYYLVPVIPGKRNFGYCGHGPHTVETRSRTGKDLYRPQQDQEDSRGGNAQAH